MVRWPKLPLSRTVSTAEMVGSDDTDMDRFPVSLIRGATPRTPAARSRACREPAGLRSRLAARPVRCAEAISRATTEDRAEEWGRVFARVAPGGGFRVQLCSSTLAVEGSQAMGPADMEGAAAPGGQPLRDVNGAG